MKIQLCVFVLFLTVILSCSPKPKTETIADSAALDSAITTTVAATQAPAANTLYLEDLVGINNHEDLVKRFGAENVKKDTHIPGPEGTEVVGSWIFPGTYDEAQVLWQDEKKFSYFMEARVETKYKNDTIPIYSTRWQSKTGIKLGTTLPEVVAANGKDFLLMGFGWDYGGIVTSWEKGKLEDKNLTIRFAQDSNEASKLNAEESNKTLGDQAISSSLPAIRKIKSLVVEMSVYVKIDE